MTNIDYRIENSVKRAKTLLNTPLDYNKYLLIKLTLEPFSCHALHHWPNTWKQINKYIYPSQPIADEGDALIERDENKFVLESHESGPEIIVYIGLANKLAELFKSIIDLAITIIKGFSDERRKQITHIKIIKRRVIEGTIEENVMEIEIPLSKKAEKSLEEKIYKLLNKNI